MVEVYRSLGYQVTHDLQLPGQQTDVLARREVEGAPALTLALECKDWSQPVGNQEVLDFVARIVAQRDASIVTGGVFVARNGFTADAKAAASGNRNVTLLSWEDLNAEILDVRNQLRERVAAYENSDIYRNYLPLKAELLDWVSLTPVDSQRSALDAVLKKWMGRSEPPIHSLFVLADFGAGKTTLLEHLEYDRATAHLDSADPRVPLLVQLRDYRQSQDLGTLLRASFRDSYYRDLPNDLLWLRIEAGQFYVLFDGFDEMVERSDEARRLDLFRELLPVLRSKSPTVLTSRPSYFVELGELDRLLSTLQDHEAAISQEGKLTSTRTDRLRRKLVDHHRETRPRAGANAGLNPRNVQVARLLALDDDQIEEFLEGRADELKAAGTSTEAVLAFIKRTYDLADLASRPMLLDLIITSVVKGGLDIDDSEKQYGASGLYETYTHTKLDYDMAKGRARQEGLPLELRREFAEQLALRMYQAATLEDDFAQMLEDLLGDDGPLKSVLEHSGLSQRQIATDFATCSFATLDQDGKCRFIHKSFRGFFVARVLRRHLKSPRHPLLSERLEAEVLYFLGGFNPTEPSVGENLWANFLHAKAPETALRRNMLVAFLFTTPDHGTRLIADGEIANAEFGRLNFEGTRLKDTHWLDCTVMDLRLAEVMWKGVGLTNVHFANLAIDDSAVELALEQSVIESARADRTDGSIRLAESSIESLSTTACSLQIAASDCRIGQLKVDDGKLVCETSGRPVLQAVDAINSHLEVGGSQIDSLRATRSAIVSDADCDGIADWGLDHCVLTLPGQQSQRTRPNLDPNTETEPDTRSVILSEGIAPGLLVAVKSGVFGALAGWCKPSELGAKPGAWGVLEADALLHGKLVLPGEANGFRWGEILLVKSGWYQREVAPGGRLSAVSLLQGFAAIWEPPATAAAFGRRLAEILVWVRDQHLRVLADEDWPRPA